MNERSLSNTQPLDIYRQTWLRYLGYLGNLGKICLPFTSKSVAQTVALTYMFSDVATKTKRTSDEGKSKGQVSVNAGDAILWQTAASVLIPNFLIKSLSEQARKLEVIRRCTLFRPNALSCMLGIAFLPLLSYPIDKSVDYIMDNTYRKCFKGIPNTCLDTYAPKGIAFSDLCTSNFSKGHKRDLNGSIDDLDKIYKEWEMFAPAMRQQQGHHNKPTRQNVEKDEDGDKKPRNCLRCSRPRNGKNRHGSKSDKNKDKKEKRADEHADESEAKHEDKQQKKHPNKHPKKDHNWMCNKKDHQDKHDDKNDDKKADKHADKHDDKHSDNHADKYADQHPKNDHSKEPKGRRQFCQR